MENLKTFLIIGGIFAFVMFLFAFFVMQMPFNLALFLASIIPIVMAVVLILSKYHELKNRK
ncbi:hypothetical protein [Streptococcus suis]|uniref:hypothetical protein n=1 Tax=Streptococcus suis TaxID=1307 RepID=UPI000462A925|nr:hypothetical protein [Streptococcus suis]MCG9914677.1 hypothetical protein [Streptococcus suis]MCG9923747.1 hypothetical protein [Streptococcus suis]MCG9931860.1 hypothetical protein [Streptococcus suis]HEL1712112.1 hypothetical protein [Streptococcus suis]HEL1972088.1 hypothetical protein [Streptococcus suis]